MMWVEVFSQAQSIGAQITNRRRTCSGDEPLRLGFGRAAIPRRNSAARVPAPWHPPRSRLGLLDSQTRIRALELGCGSGHSLRYLADRGAQELWGVDLSPVQIAFAQTRLRGCASTVRLIEGPMEAENNIPAGHFDLVFSIYGLGWTTDLRTTTRLAARYLRPGGAFLFSGEHPMCSASSGAVTTTRWPRRHYF